MSAFAVSSCSKRDVIATDMASHVPTLRFLSALSDTALMKIHLCGVAVVVGMMASGCGGARPDVELAGPTLTIDTTNPVFPVLAKALPANPKANTFRLTWSITPNPKRPTESLPHFLVYDRAAKTLALHRDQPRFEQYSGVTDAIIANVAAKKGNVTDLVKAGCKSQSMPEK